MWSTSSLISKPTIRPWVVVWLALAWQAGWLVGLSAFLHLSLCPTILEVLRIRWLMALSRMFESLNSWPVSVNAVYLVDFPIAFSDLIKQQSQYPFNALLFRGFLLVKKWAITCCSNVCCTVSPLLIRGLWMICLRLLVPMILRYYYESTHGTYLIILKALNMNRPTFFWLKVDADMRAPIRACHIYATLNSKINL